VKRRLAFLAATTALTLALPAAVLAADETFKADLSHSVEVPPPTVPDGYAGGGTATVTLSGDTITYEVTYSGLTGPVAAAHIHYGEPGVAGPVMLPLDAEGAGADGTLSGTLSEADFAASDEVATYSDALAAIRDGESYVNVHTEANPKGELRADLGMAEQEPPDTSTAPASDMRIPLVALGLALVAFGALTLRRMSTVAVRRD
jgi:hypothetical protein